jgi:autonomous glycyl radical cofactor GrcA
MDMPEVLPVAEPLEDSPPVEVTGGFSLSNEEFQRRVEVVMAAIEDPEKYRRCIAEIHTYLSLFEQGFRQMQNEMIASGGPMGMFRKMFMGR